MVQQWVDDGLYSEEEARTSGASHILTRALGVDAAIEVDTLEHPLAAGDVLLLCSDGLSDRMPHSMIQEIMAEHLPAMPETMRALIDAANEMGGNDNIAVGLLRVERRSRRSIKGIVKRLSKKHPKDSTPS